MRETGIGTGLILIATGAVLAFAVHLRSAAVDISAIGAILMVIGIIGLLLSFVAWTEYWPWSHRRPYYNNYDSYDRYEPRMTPPHEHRHVDTRDVVYDDPDRPTVERERRIEPR